jgi:CHAD domain
MKARKVKGLDPHGTLADNAERIVRVRLDELYSFVPKALDPAETTAQHDMRIAAKRLRYILEVTGDTCFGPYAATALKRTKDLQDLLGELHDCDVQLPRVLARAEELRTADVAEARARAGDAEDLEPTHATGTAHAGARRGLETLAVYLQARRRLLFDRFLALWTDLQRAGFRARLDYAVGERPPAPAVAAPAVAAPAPAAPDAPAPPAGDGAGLPATVPAP